MGSIKKCFCLPASVAMFIAARVTCFKTTHAAATGCVTTGVFSADRLAWLKGCAEEAFGSLEGREAAFFCFCRESVHNNHGCRSSARRNRWRLVGDVLPLCVSH